MTATDLTCHLAALHLHPVKSCGGLLLDDAWLTETGLDLDRAWMVVDEDGEMLTQRELPVMSQVSCALRLNEVVLRAPGMLALHLRDDVVETACRVRVWDDEVRAYDMGRLAGQWFTDLLAPHLGRSSRRLRLVRFDPEHRRLSPQRWTGAVQAPNLFSDGFPLLVTSTASLDDLNRRLQARGAAPVTMQHFRPNLVLEGLQPWDEDHLDTLLLDTDEGAVTLRLVKPCVRCGIPNVDPDTGATGAEPGATLAGFRADPRLDGGITFGVNAVVAAGPEAARLRRGMPVLARWRF
jgi:uncharacterized protein YcbX